MPENWSLQSHRWFWQKDSGRKGEARTSQRSVENRSWSLYSVLLEEKCGRSKVPEAEGISPKLRTSSSDMYKARSLVLFVKRCQLGPQEGCVFCHWSLATGDCVNVQGWRCWPKGEDRSSYILGETDAPVSVAPSSDAWVTILLFCMCVWVLLLLCAHLWLSYQIHGTKKQHFVLFGAFLKAQF